MGAAASINTRDELALLSAEELGNKVAELGEEYVVYKGGFISKNIDGKAISALSQDERIQTLKDIGVENDAHQNALIAEFEKIKVTPAMEVAEETKVEESSSAEQKEIVSEDISLAKDEKSETAAPTETPSSKRMATDGPEEISSAKRAATEGTAVESIPEAHVAEIVPAGEDVPMNTSPRVDVVPAAPQEIA